MLPGNYRAVGHRIEKHLPARGMESLLTRSCRNRNGANERESSTKGSTESLGILAQTVSTVPQRFGVGFSAGPGKTCCRNKRQQYEPPVPPEAGSQLKSQGKWLGVGGTFLWDFTYLCWNLTTKVYAPLDGYSTNVNTSSGAYVYTGDQLLALVDSSSFWIAAYFKETQLLSIKPGRTVKITLMGYHDEPFEGKFDSVAWGIFVQDGSSGTSTGLLAAVNQTVDWVRLPQRFPVRVQIIGKPPIPLRIGQTVTVAVLAKASLTPDGLSKKP